MNRVLPLLLALLTLMAISGCGGSRPHEGVGRLPDGCVRGHQEVHSEGGYWLVTVCDEFARP